MITFPLLDPSGVLTVTALMSVFWLLLTIFALRRWGSHKEYASRIVSLVHAVLSVIVTGFRLYQDYGTPNGRINVDMSGDQQVAVLVTGSYFVVDTLGMFFFDYFDFRFLMHHIGAGGSLFWTVFAQTNGYEMVFTVFILELSNPFMHGRWLLLHSNFPATNWLFRVCEEGFFVTFGLCRVIVGPVLVYSIVVGTGPLFWKIAGIGVLVVSAHFFLSAVRNRLSDVPWL